LPHAASCPSLSVRCGSGCIGARRCTWDGSSLAVAVRSRHLATR
jgi:hypothetical protein